MLVGPEKSLEDEQSRMNRSTWGQWDWYASHRQAIERLIVPERRGGRICVLGAGNCNDLDLKWLVEAYAEARLVDIDRGALERAVARQGVAGHARLHLDAPVDLTGMADLTAGWKGRRVSDAEVAAAVRAVSADGAKPGGGEFDVVVSPCVLSQLLCGVRDLLGKDHPGWPSLKATIRARHLRTLMAAVADGGRGVMAVDLASTSALPGLDRAREGELLDLMGMCVRERKCFRGLEPKELDAVSRREGAVGGVSVSAPWLWHLGFRKAFLCYGLTLRRGR